MGLLARLFGRLRRKPQQQVLDEHEAYERCHGGHVAEIRVVPVAPPKPRVLPRLPGDHLRRCFEERLEARRRPPGDRLQPAGETETRDERGSVDEDPLELLRRRAVVAAQGGGREAGLDGDVNGQPGAEAEVLDRLE